MNTLIKQLSTEGLRSILEDHSHIAINTLHNREDYEQVLQINLNDGLIDEIELITVLSGE